MVSYESMFHMEEVDRSQINKGKKSGIIIGNMETRKLGDGLH